MGNFYLYKAESAFGDICAFAVNGTSETNGSPANGFVSYMMRPDMTAVKTAKQKMNELIK